MQALGRRRACLGALALFALSGVALRGLAAAEPGSGFTNFETEPVRPLAMAPDGSRLYALNTADDRLEVFDVTAAGLLRRGEVGVGLRPVAVAAAGDTEVWVANHLSDTVSEVDVADPARPRVVRTVAVGDEPRDLVLAGPAGDKLLVSTALRDEPANPTAPRGAVWVIDTARPDAPPQVLRLPGLKLRGLAVSADGATAYAAVFKSGNGTATVAEGVLPPPTAPVSPTVAAFADAPRTGRILQQRGDKWFDGPEWDARDVSGALPFHLADEDLFVLDTSGPVVRLVQAVSGVGTVLFNLAVQPGSGEVWVTNTEAHNATRFEPALRGQVVDHRVTRLLPGAGGLRPVAQDLNPLVDRARLPAPPGEIAASLAQPTALVFRADGSRAYVAAFGSAKVAVLDDAGQVRARIAVGFGPGGLALDERHERLFVLNQLAASVSVIDLASTQVTATVPLAYDPTPAELRAGRPFLYDAARTSGHGDQSCASCHVFADMDGLAWDLGDPNGSPDDMPFGLTHNNFLLKPRVFSFHPLKGPMITQSFRGLAGTGPLHWRGDRFGPEDDPGNSLASFKRFNHAFVSLNGRPAELTDEEMTAFGRFILTVRYPPNPLERLDRTLTPEQQRGAALFGGPELVDSGLTNCAGCHTLPLGTNGRINFEGNRSSQDFKAPHLRNLYEKLGRSNSPGRQLSGFGFTHDGALDSVTHFLNNDVFDLPGADEAADERMRADLAAYVLAFDTGMAPAVGRQVTVPGGFDAAGQALLDQLVQRAGVGDCDLIARGWRGAEERGWLLAGAGFRPDRAAEALVPLADLVADAGRGGQDTSFTCVPPGDGLRSALDRDLDGHLNGDERAAGSNPADPRSYPGAIGTATPSPTATPTGAPPTATRTGVPPTATATGRALAPRAWLPWAAH